ncbi:MAG: trigger factor [Actinomycetota bacterium]|nr:trigger factor [Actinomycetota bacterium]
MSTTITETGPFERMVKFRLSDEQIAAGRAATARKLSQDMKLKGFRPGRAPLPVVEAAVGADRLRSEVIDDLVPPALTEVLTAEEINPAVTPQLESLNDVDGGVEVEVRVTLWPTIELPTYKGRDIEVTSPLVTDEEMEAQVKRMLEQFATVEEVERPAEVGDFVSVDVGASSGGEPLAEAAAADLLYEVGSGLLIEGMDERLVGQSAGGVVEFEAPLPVGFGDRAGEQAQFKVTVHEVKERILPELDDAWVDENTEFEAVDELYAELRERLSDAKRQAVSRQFAERALSTLVDQVDVQLPDGLIRAEMDDHLHRFLHRLQENELTLEDYFRVSGIDQETFVDDLRAQAELSLRNQLVLEALAEAEGIEVTEEDLSSTLRALATQSGDPVAYLRAFRESGRELALASDILRNRALDVVFSNANPVDEDGNPIDLSLQVTEVEAEVVEAEPLEVEALPAEALEEEEE